jgi:ABC-type lipoprotein export system ATPase subunit
MIGGEDITRLPAGERATRRRRNIGVILQRDNLHPLLDVGDNVGLAMRLDRRPKAEIRERTQQLLASVGLSDRAGQLSTTLSGGEAQRVAVAAAMAPRPVVLLADELTGELDDETTAQVLDLLESLRSREGTAILTVTHNPLVAERADRRMAMRDGEVVDVS